MTTIKNRRTHKDAAFCESFPPIATKGARVLVLGSMPGVNSLQEQQYYAHPRNSFWKIMSALFDAPVDSYAQRVALIKSSQLALWDVLEACERPGSLDSSIVKDTLRANDFADFFIKHKNITHVFFNGGAAADSFNRYALPALPPDVAQRLTFTRLPSTSPAMASKNFETKLSEWRAVKAAL